MVGRGLLILGILACTRTCVGSVLPEGLNSTALDSPNGISLDDHDSIVLPTNTTAGERAALNADNGNNTMVMGVSMDSALEGNTTDLTNSNNSTSSQNPEGMDDTDAPLVRSKRHGKKGGMMGGGGGMMGGGCMLCDMMGMLSQLKSKLGSMGMGGCEMMAMMGMSCGQMMSHPPPCGHPMSGCGMPPPPPPC